LDFRSRSAQDGEFFSPESGRLWQLNAVEWTVEGGHIGQTDSSAILLNNIAINGNLALIQWLLDHRIGHCSPYCAEEAMTNEHHNVAMQLMQNRADSWSEASMDKTIGHDRLRLVQWLVEN
jgi:hypothetical protein